VAITALLLWTLLVVATLLLGAVLLLAVATPFLGAVLFLAVATPFLGAVLLLAVATLLLGAVLLLVVSGRSSHLVGNDFLKQIFYHREYDFNKS